MPTPKPLRREIRAQDARWANAWPVGNKWGVYIDKRSGWDWRHPTKRPRTYLVDELPRMPGWDSWMPSGTNGTMVTFKPDYYCNANPETGECECYIPPNAIGTALISELFGTDDGPHEIKDRAFPSDDFQEYLDGQLLD